MLHCSNDLTPAKQHSDRKETFLCVCVEAVFAIVVSPGTFHRPVSEVHYSMLCTANKHACFNILADERQK